MQDIRLRGTARCESCAGVGTLYDEKCSACAGVGRIPVEVPVGDLLDKIGQERRAQRLRARRAAAEDRELELRQDADRDQAGLALEVDAEQLIGDAFDAALGEGRR